MHRMVELQQGTVMSLSEDLRDGVDREGLASPALWDEAQASIDRINARPDLARARFELLLHAARHPELQGIIRESRNAFVEATTRLMGDPDPRIRDHLIDPGTAGRDDAEQPPGVQNPEAAARMVIAMLDGLTLHQLSAPDPSVTEMSATLMLGTIGAAALLPAHDAPGDVTPTPAGEPGVT